MNGACGDCTVINTLRNQLERRFLFQTFQYGNNRIVVRKIDLLSLVGNSLEPLAMQNVVDSEKWQKSIVGI